MADSFSELCSPDIAHDDYCNHEEPKGSMDCNDHILSAMAPARTQMSHYEMQSSGKAIFPFTATIDVKQTSDYLLTRGFCFENGPDSPGNLVQLHGEASRRCSINENLSQIQDGDRARFIVAFLQYYSTTGAFEYHQAGPVKCIFLQCQEVFPTISSMLSHLLTCPFYGKTLYRCEACGHVQYCPTGSHGNGLSESSNNFQTFEDIEDLQLLSSYSPNTEVDSKGRDAKNNTMLHRRKKASSLKSDNWKPLKEMIIEKYITQQLPLHKVMKIIKEERNFEATERQYKAQLKRWDISKNRVSRIEMQFIVKKRAQLSAFLENTSQVIFKCRGELVTDDKIQKWIDRERKIGSTEAISQHMVDLEGTTTPSTVSYYVKLYEDLDVSLGEFRLVSFITNSISSPTDLITCGMKQSSLAAMPRYTAVSYAWNSSDRTCRTIWLNGMQREVTVELYTLLGYLKASRNGLLYIDSLCVDKKNITERSQQVMLMREIYSRAQEVLIWLGPATNSSSLALKFLQKLHENPDESTQMDQQSWAAIDDFFAHPYWKRIWSLQELSFAKQTTFVYGQESINWEALAGAVATWRIHADFSQSQTHHKCLENKRLRFEKIRYLEPFIYCRSRCLESRDKRTDPLDLKTVLRISRHLKARVDTDNVFAILGLLSANSNIINPDYSLTIQEVFRETLLASLRHYRSFSVFCGTKSGVGWPNDGDWTDVPSWIPDFRTKGEDDFFANSSNALNASRGELVDADISLDGQILTVSAIFVDQLDELSFHCEPDAWLWPYKDVTWKSNRHPTGIPQIQAHFWTLLACPEENGQARDLLKDPNTLTHYFNLACGYLFLLGSLAEKRKKVNDEATSKQSNLAAMSDYAQGFACWLDGAQQDISEEDLLTRFLGKEADGKNWLWPETPRHSDRGETCASLFHCERLEACQERSLFTTHQGYIVLGPPGVLKSDQLYVILGCDSPIILRPTPGGLYKVVGDCYCLGMNNGEAIQMWKNGVKHLGRVSLI